MRRSLGLVAVLIGAMVVGGCGKAKLDTSSEEAMKKSVEEMEKPLDAAKKQQFEMALAQLTVSNGLTAALGDPKAGKAGMDKLNGKTVDEIIEQADKAKADAMK